mmetsp:Transcript_28435/g.62566  ORF Transcript_28435/g.62566 Transcript_28435/m.62566 type:complete len:94 (+) Transcript_28435:244-525(+)
MASNRHNYHINYPYLIEKTAQSNSHNLRTTNKEQRTNKCHTGDHTDMQCMCSMHNLQPHHHMQRSEEAAALLIATWNTSQSQLLVTNIMHKLT